jgi:hypothetical protein
MPLNEQDIQIISKLLDEKFEKVEQRFEEIDQRFEKVEQRFEEIDQRFERIEQRFERIDQRFNEIDERFEEMEQKFDKKLENLHDKIRKDIAAAELRILKTIRKEMDESNAVQMGLIFNHFPSRVEVIEMIEERIK